MSAAADRPISLRLGTRVALLGALLVVATWLAVTLDWVRDQQWLLDRRPMELAQDLGGRLSEELELARARTPTSLDQALLTAQSRVSQLQVLRQKRRIRKVLDEPDLVGVVQAELEAAVVELDAEDAAWTRTETETLWSTGLEPTEWGAVEVDGLCLLREEDGSRRLARCQERELASDSRRVWAGVASLIDLSRVRGPEDIGFPPGTGKCFIGTPHAGSGVSWAFLTADGSESVVALDAEWPTGVPITARSPRWALHRGERGRDWSLEPAPFPFWRGDHVVRGQLLRVYARTGPERLDWLELLQGRAGTKTAAWHRQATKTGGFAIAALLVFCFLGWRINGAFAPVVRAARGLGAENLDMQVPIRRSDEIGAIAAVLNDLGTSLKHARSSWEREAKLAAWRDVARGLAHEIKNPLTPIRGTVENLLRWREEEPERFSELVESRLGTILEEVEQLSRLASAFSDFAKLPPPQTAPANLNGLLNDVAALQLQDREGIVLDERLDAALGQVLLDAGQIRQVATNLMKNAREALGEAGGTVRLESGRHGTGAWFAVSDDGPGVDEASLDSLFVPGWSTRKHEGGSGLGLWLCHRIVLEHGGGIEASRSELGGLRIRVTLPEG